MSKNHFPPNHLKRYPSRCTSCRGHVEEALVSLVLPSSENGTSKIVRGVPAGVCRQCGEQFFRLDVLAEIEEILARPPSDKEEVPVWDFAKAAS